MQLRVLTIWHLKDMVVIMITWYLIVQLLEIKTNQNVKQTLIQQNQDCLQVEKMV